MYWTRLPDGTWDKVDCSYIPVPANLISAVIANYARTHFEGAKIVKIDKECYGYDVELSNELDLKFNKNGQLINIDD